LQLVCRRNYHSFTSCRRNSLPISAEDIHQRLNKLNEDSEIQPFYGSSFRVEDSDHGLFGIDLADKVRCDRQFIYETGIIAPEALLLPYTGVNIDGIAQDIIKVSKLPTSAPRMKYLLATLRGVGGGKTRMIEETRIRLGLLYPNWLPIAVTFNHNTSISDYECDWKDPSMIVAFAVCCRMIATVYNLPIGKAQCRLDEVLKGVGRRKKSGAEMRLLTEDLIVGTVQHIAERVKRVKPTVDSMVLFIDESARLIENCNYPKGGKIDGYALLRQTILGGRVDKILKTSLVMTSLSVSVFGTTESDRIIKPIVLASALSVDHIVDRMWIPSLASSTTPIGNSEKAMLKWLAAAVSAAPRLVELMGTALQAKFIDTGSASSQGLSLSQSMGAVISEFEGYVRACYPDLPFPAGIYLHALMHKQKLAMDDTTLEYIRYSTFTNSITEFPGRKKENRLIVPESALSILVNTGEVEDVHRREIQKGFQEIWVNLIQSLSSASGQPLEDVFARVLRMRLLSTHLKEHNRGHTTLKDLLAIDVDKIKYTIGGAPYNAAKIYPSGDFVLQDSIKKSFQQWEGDTFDSVQQIDENLAKKQFLSNLLSQSIIVPTAVVSDSIWSSRRRPEWKKAIRATTSSLVLREPKPNDDHCNLMLFIKMMLNMTASPECGRNEIVLVFEEKSGAENSVTDKRWWGHFVHKEKGPYDQYAKFSAAVASITEEDLEGDHGGYLRALKEGRYLYIYVTTHTGPSVYLAPEDLPHISSNSLGVLVLSRNETQRIMGATFDVYALTRSVL
jgi:hypothetical protein